MSGTHAMRVAAPRVHCGWTRRQRPPPSMLVSDCDEVDICGGGGGGGDDDDIDDIDDGRDHEHSARGTAAASFAEAYAAGSTVARTTASLVHKYYDLSRDGVLVAASPDVATNCVVRMEDYVLVDRQRRGGNDPRSADEIERVTVVMCDGHGSTSMLGGGAGGGGGDDGSGAVGATDDIGHDIGLSLRSHGARRAPPQCEVHVGGAEMARLAAHSLLNEVHAGATLDAAFVATERRLQCAMLDGAVRHSTLVESLVDGDYFRRLPALPSALRSSATIVSKTCDVALDDDNGASSAVRYVRQSGERIDPVCGTSATVIVYDAAERVLRCGNVGSVLAALFTAVDGATTRDDIAHDAARRTLIGGGDGEPETPVAGFTWDWLTEEHTVHNAAERRRLERTHGTVGGADTSSSSSSSSPPPSSFAYAAAAPASSCDDVTEVFRLSRALGQQSTMRRQGMSAEASVAEMHIARTARSRWLVVGTSGFWRAMRCVTDTNAPTAAAAHVARYLTPHANDPNAVADSLVDVACARPDADNVALVVMVLP